MSLWTWLELPRPQSPSPVTHFANKATPTPIRSQVLILQTTPLSLWRPFSSKLPQIGHKVHILIIQFYQGSPYRRSERIYGWTVVKKGGSLQEWAHTKQCTWLSDFKVRQGNLTLRAFGGEQVSQACYYSLSTCWTSRITVCGNLSWQPLTV